MKLKFVPAANSCCHQTLAAEVMDKCVCVFVCVQSNKFDSECITLLNDYNEVGLWKLRE